MIWLQYNVPKLKKSHRIQRSQEVNKTPKVFNKNNIKVMDPETNMDIFRKYNFFFKYTNREENKATNRATNGATNRATNRATNKATNRRKKK